MKIRIEELEWWPVYRPISNGLIEADISDELVHRIHYAFVEFWEVQKILKEAYERGKRYE